MRCSCVFGVRVNGRLKMRCAPRCSTLRFSTWSVSRRSGGRRADLSASGQEDGEKERQGERDSGGAEEEETIRRNGGETLFIQRSRSPARPLSRSILTKCIC